MAELVEEYTSLTRRILYVLALGILIVHGLFMLLEDLPLVPLGVGMVAHSSYLWLLQSFPFVRFASPAFLCSFALLVASHYLWITHFASHYHEVTHVLCFFVLNVWIVPFGFFISLSVNESTLPDRLAQSADDAYTDSAARSRQKSGLLSAFSAARETRDGLMPGMGKKV
jgi:hypothetical protein